MSPKPRRPPGNLSHLQRLANTAADRAGMPVGRYQRWINTRIISAVLDRVRAEDGEPLFTLKGGAAMELRIGLTARASKDYDAAFRARAEDLLTAVDQALSGDWQGFQLQRTEPQRVSETDALRMDIKLSYKGRSWGTVQLDVAPAEGRIGQEIDRVLATSLDMVQLDGLDRIACVSIRYQIAQKIHACTEVLEDRPNDRFRDLIDLALLRDLVEDDEISKVRDACVELFLLRDKHAWPPEVTLWPAWPDGFGRMATEISFYTDDVEVAADGLRALIAEIDSALEDAS
jgi:hypothetical protein